MRRGIRVYTSGWAPLPRGIPTKYTHRCGERAPPGIHPFGAADTTQFSFARERSPRKDALSCTDWQSSSSIHLIQSKSYFINCVSRRGYSKVSSRVSPQSLSVTPSIAVSELRSSPAVSQYRVRVCHRTWNEAPPVVWKKVGKLTCSEWSRTTSTHLINPEVPPQQRKE